MFRRRPSKPQASRVATVLPNESGGFAGRCCCVFFRVFKGKHPPGDGFFFSVFLFFVSGGSAHGISWCFLFVVLLLLVFCTVAGKNHETFAVLICKMVDVPAQESIIQRVDWMFPS